MAAADLPLLVALVPLAIASGLVSGSETALFGLTQADRLRLRRAHPEVGRRLARLLARPRRLLVTLLLLNMIVNVTYFVLTSVLAWRAQSGVAALAVSVLGVLGLILVGELLAKLIAHAHRGRFALLVTDVLTAVTRLVGPVAGALEQLAVVPVTRLARPDPTSRAAHLSAEELAALIELGAQRGVIETDEQQLLRGIVELGELRVREVMTPRVDLRWVRLDAPRDAVRTMLAADPHRPVLVCDRTPDERVLGLVDARRWLSAAERAALEQFVVAAEFVPETARLDQLLERFRSIGRDWAVVVDEHGGLAGLVGFEDVVGRLLEVAPRGASDDNGQVEAIGPGQWLVPGRLNIRDWAEPLGLPATARPARVATLAGLMLALLGRVPKEQDSIQVGNVRLTVATMHGREIERVLVSLVSPADRVTEARRS